jgi:sugar phosphate isomerase/epimerase
MPGEQKDVISFLYDFPHHIEPELVGKLHPTLQQAAALVARAGRTNGGVLVDALHLHRSAGTPADLAAVPAWMLQAAQICDGQLAHPPTEAALIEEAREARLLPGEGELPLRDLIAALPAHVAYSAEVPMRGLDADTRLRLAYEATKRAVEAVRG